MIYLIRRLKLGKGSCKGISGYSQTGIQVFRNDAPLPPADLVFRWGCTSAVPCKKIVNEAEAIHLVSGKRKFREVLQEQELCPMTYFREQDVVFPAIVRPRVHSQGRKLWVVNGPRELHIAMDKCPAGWYASAIVPKVAEYRVYVAQGRVLTVARKYPGNPNDIAWNVAQGGRFEVCHFGDWPLKAVKRAVEAYKLSGLDFGGVDVMVDAEGGVYVLEINAAPSLTSPYRKQCFAKVFDWIVRNGKEEIPLIAKPGGYRKFIHPAIDGGALLV